MLIAPMRPAPTGIAVYDGAFSPAAGKRLADIDISTLGSYRRSCGATTVTEHFIESLLHELGEACLTSYTYYLLHLLKGVPTSRRRSDAFSDAAHYDPIPYECTHRGLAPCNCRRATRSSTGVARPGGRCAHTPTSTSAAPASAASYF